MKYWSPLKPCSLSQQRTWGLQSQQVQGICSEPPSLRPDKTEIAFGSGKFFLENSGLLMALSPSGGLPPLSLPGILSSEAVFWRRRGDGGEGRDCCFCQLSLPSWP